MRDELKTVIGSTVVAAVVSSLLSWVVAEQRISSELQSRQVESGYEALVKANGLLWTAEQEVHAAGNDAARLARAQAAQRDADLQYIAARQKIAAFGDARVVAAMAAYYRDGHAIRACDEPQKFAADTRIYQAIRTTIGSSGWVSDCDLAAVIFMCRLEAPGRQPLAAGDSRCRRAGP